MTLFQAADATEIYRNCQYEIRVKSQSAGIASFKIPNGDMQTKGMWTHSDGLAGSLSGREGHAKKIARYAASKYAKTCLDAAATSRGKPRSCRPSGRTGVIRYNINNLQQVAKNALCNQVRQLGHRGPIREYEIYAFTLGSGDVRRECGHRLSDNPYHGIHKGVNVSCSSGLSEAQAEERWSKWYSDKSPTEMRSYIRKHCRDRRNGARSSINRWAIDERTGKIRVYFSCR
jgi:hypothetical protein